MFCEVVFFLFRWEMRTPEGTDKYYSPRSEIGRGDDKNYVRQTEAQTELSPPIKTYR
jgi:hypothetical protein